LKIDHKVGPIVQENNFYAYGMPMPGLSWSRLNFQRERTGYQGLYAQYDEETKLNSFQLRMYDARVGRWLSKDPYGQYASPYTGMGNNPVNGVDPNGGLFGKWRAEFWAWRNNGTSYQENGEWYAYGSTSQAAIGNSFGRQGLVMGSKLYDFGVEGNVSFKASMGLQKINDAVVSGVDVQLASARLGEFKIGSSWSLEKGGKDTFNKPFTGPLKDGKLLIDTGAQVEGVPVPVGTGIVPMDFKVKYTSALDPSTRVLTPYEVMGGVGGPFVEVRGTHNFQTNVDTWKAGLQEDGTLIKIPTGFLSELAIKWDANAQLVMTVSEL
jgi:RHS repeat-associated protein